MSCKKGKMNWQQSRPAFLDFFMTVRKWQQQNCWQHFKPSKGEIYVSSDFSIKLQCCLESDVNELSLLLSSPCKFTIQLLILLEFVIWNLAATPQQSRDVYVVLTIYLNAHDEQQHPLMMIFYNNEGTGRMQRALWQCLPDFRFSHKARGFDCH